MLCVDGQVCEAVGGSSMSTTDVRTATQRMCHLCGSLSLATDSVLTKLDTSLVGTYWNLSKNSKGYPVLCVCKY